MAAKSFVFKFGDIEVREREFSLVKAGAAVPVEPKAFRVLLILLRNPQKLIPKEELLNAIWGETAVSENSLTRAIALLRKLLGDEARDPRYIETVATVGYRWVCKVEVAEEPSAAAEAPAATETAESKAGARKQLWTWALAGGGVLALCLAAAVWYLHRPLPPPRITAYTQLTRDGRSKQVGGTDGSRVYFTQSSPSQIAEVGVHGGEIALLPLEMPAAEVQLMDISPDGSNALVGDYEQNHGAPGQWVVPVLGGAAKRLEDGDGEIFSPDGGSVVYSTPSGDIFKVRIDGSDKRKLASMGAQALGFSWSPDGKVVRFSMADGGLWEMSQDGAGVHRLLAGWKEGLPCCGRWTRDGGLFLFLANGQIWALDERRSLFRQPPSLPIQLTNGPIQWGPPIPGRDGKTIFVDGANERGELSRIDPKTGGPQPFLEGISAEFVSFSPDGKLVAYVTFPEGNLWRADRDGSDRMQLTRSPVQVINPRWSPDSKEIVYTTETPNGHSSIGRLSAVDGTPLWLMSEEPAEMHDANWSPDGKRVLFAQSPGYFATAKRDLRIVDLGTRQVTVLPGSEGLWSPRWSSDGRYIAALRGFSVDLPVLDLATRQWRTLPGSGDVEYPSFSRDSRFLYFLRVGRGQGVFRIPVAGGKAVRVVDMTGWHLAFSYGYSMSLDPTDAPLVLRDTGTDDIYALTLEGK